MHVNVKHINHKSFAFLCKEYDFQMCTPIGYTVMWDSLNDRSEQVKHSNNSSDKIGTLQFTTLTITIVVYV